jgi:hypothetical protein
MNGSKNHRWVFIFCIVILLPAIAFFVFDQIISYFILSQVPPWISTQRVEYHVDSKQGSGAGSNESTFTVISLSQETARGVESFGSRFFINARMHWNSDPKNKYDEDITEWKPTPVIFSDEWAGRSGSEELTLYDFLCGDPVCLTVSDKHRVMFEETVNRPGSFYAQKRGTYLVINPSTLMFYKIAGR